MLRRIAGLSAIILAAAAPLQAQAYYYPALQPSRIAEREYNFALADIGGGGGTAIIFQWREGLGNPRMQFTMDAGFVDSDVNGADTRLVIGGGLAYQLTTSTNDMPFDVVLAGGLGLSTGDDLTVLRIPFGAVVGHRFPLEGNLAITPFVHPRLSFDRISFPAGSPVDSDSDTNLEVDIGANFEFTPQMALRIGATLGDYDAVAFAFAWTPKGLRK